MPIPNDPLGREWIDISNENPKMVDGFRSSLAAVIAFDHGRTPRALGTAFFIGASLNPKLAISISAKHVFEGALNVQRPKPRHAPSTPSIFVPASSKHPSIDKDKLRGVWMGSKSADFLVISHLSYNNELDAACCIFTPQDEFVTQFTPATIPLDTTIPAVGEVVHMVAQGGLNISDFSPTPNRSGKGDKFTIHRRVNIRIGTVTAVYPKGIRHYKWPCFTTSIPAEPGMSGGFVYLPRDGEVIAACGVVSAELPEQPEQITTDYNICGQSIIACAWPMLSLVVPTHLGPNPPMKTLYDMMLAGQLPTAVGGIDHISLADTGNGNFSMFYGKK